MKYIVFAVISIVVMVSCGEKEENTQEEQKHVREIHFPNYRENNSGLGFILWSPSDTITIEVGFSDCGEWGGHTEKVFLFNDSNGIKVARYIVDTADCSNIKVFGNYASIDPEQNIVVIDTTIKISRTDEILFNLFIHRVLELKLNDGNFGAPNIEEEEIIIIVSDAGSWIRINNKDRSLNIEYSNWDNMSDTWFGIIRHEIFGDILREAGRIRTWYR